MTQEAALEEKAAPAAPQCRHHWLIETPQGATSWGTCKLCGERREFANSASDALWEGGGFPTGKSRPVVSYDARIGSLRDDGEGF